MARKTTEVAAAAILRPDGSFLLGQRPPGTFYPGYWEFPGGKLEPGESPRAALGRELQEELGIRVVRAFPWIVREHGYEHAQVRLHFFRVLAWEGEIRDIEHTALTWQRPGAASVEPMLPANAPVLRALALPQFYGITHAAEIGVERQLARLEHALNAGLRLVQVREPRLAPAQRIAFARHALELAQRYGAKVLVNSEIELARRIGADGVHLKAGQLASLGGRPDFDLVGASCHDAAALARAAQLELDFATVGPVLATASHPGVQGIGWERFAHLAGGCALPVFAIGGLEPQHMETAWECGAHGIAAIRAAWRD